MNAIARSGAAARAGALPVLLGLTGPPQTAFGHVADYPSVRSWTPAG